jgi:hypothetical protein
MFMWRMLLYLLPLLPLVVLVLVLVLVLMIVTSPHLRLGLAPRN